MNRLLNTILNIGLRRQYKPWETFLTRKLNLITLIAMSNMSIAILFFTLTGYTQFIIYCAAAFLAAPAVILLNRVSGYIAASYAFYFIGFIFLFFVNLAQGIQSYACVFYFPVVISLVQLLGRKETIKHLVIISLSCFVSVSLIAFGFKYEWLPTLVGSQLTTNLAVFNIMLGMLTAIAFIIAVVRESLSQEERIEKMLTEKEILLAEVFHRVKNNMNIVTSLLNLKKNASDSVEVKEALEDCRGRVYSMALVHQKVFNSDKLMKLDFKNYVEDLVTEVVNSLGGNKSVKVNLKLNDVLMQLTNAIPCGLILNELVTNSYKHAFNKDNILEISISLKKTETGIILMVKDNGPGLTKEAISKPNSLGIDLVKSLAEQIGAEYSFKNDGGLIFEMHMKN